MNRLWIPKILLFFSYGIISGINQGKLAQFLFQEGEGCCCPDDIRVKDWILEWILCCLVIIFAYDVYKYFRSFISSSENTGGRICEVDCSFPRSMEGLKIAEASNGTDRQKKVDIKKDSNVADLETKPVREVFEDVLFRKRVTKEAMESGVIECECRNYMHAHFADSHGVDLVDIRHGPLAHVALEENVCGDVHAVSKKCLRDLGRECHDWRHEADGAPNEPKKTENGEAMPQKDLKKEAADRADRLRVVMSPEDQENAMAVSIPASTLKSGSLQRSQSLIGSGKHHELERRKKCASLPDSMMKEPYMKTRSGVKWNEKMT